MKKYIISIIMLAIFCSIGLNVFAEETTSSEGQRSAPKSWATADFMALAGDDLSEFTPCVIVPPIEKANLSFDEVKSRATFYDKIVITPEGSALQISVSKEEDGSLSLASARPFSNPANNGLTQYINNDNYDDVVILQDFRDTYVMVHKGDDVSVIPVEAYALRRASGYSGKMEFELKEFLNAAIVKNKDYEERIINAEGMGGYDCIMDFIGQEPAKNYTMLIILISVSCVAIISLFLIFIIKSKISKKSQKNTDI